MKHSLTQLIGKFFHRIIPVFLLTLIACGGDDAPSGSSGPSVVYMWPSTQSTNGNIGGVNGATAICETDASGIGGLAAGLTHRAVIATSANDPRDYFSNNPPVQRPDGTVIINTYADFFDRTQTATNSVGASYRLYWIGIDLTNGGIISNTCSNWTSGQSSSVGDYGDGSVTTISRMYDGDTACDGGSLGVLCVSY